MHDYPISNHYSLKSLCPLKPLSLVGNGEMPYHLPFMASTNVMKCAFQNSQSIFATKYASHTI